MHQSIFSLRASNTSITRVVPSTNGPSSSLVISSAKLPWWLGCKAINCSKATTHEAKLPFISAAPRPYKKPSLRVGSNGGVCHSSTGPVGTTSVCPAKASTGFCVPRRAQKLSTAPKRMRSTLKPMASRRAIINAWQPLSSGVTDARPIRSWAKAMVADTAMV